MASRALVKPVEIQGLRELQKALRDMDGESQKRLRVVLNEAAETVAAGARRRVPRGPSGKARGSIKPMSSQREAKVVGGGRKAMYYGFLDFGNKVRGGGGVGRKDSHPRKFVEGGRYIYPTYAANRRTILIALAESITDLARDAGLQVSDG